MASSSCVSFNALLDCYEPSLQEEGPRHGHVAVARTGMCPTMQGSFASRISHSCSPNCQAQVMACGGRLTIALYTMRQVSLGEELTFDYASVTESEREFRAAICLCGSQLCR